MDFLNNIQEIISVLISIIVAVQAIINYFLSPEKAEKYNWLGKMLDVLSKTKSGLSPKKESKI